MQGSADIACRSTLRYRGGEWNEKEDVVIQEEAFTIAVNGKKIASVICSPSRLEEMAVGFLVSEGWINEKETVTFQGTDWKNGTIYLEADSFEGVRHIPAFRKSSAALTVEPQMVLELAVRLEEQSELFKKTGGAHCAALTDQKNLWIFMEDVGRHNTLDKLWGYCIMNGISMEDKVVVFSGRVAHEIVVKVGKMGCPVLIARSAPTDRALRLARDLGITVISFAREKSFNVYTGAGRFNGAPVPDRWRGEQI